MSPFYRYLKFYALNMLKENIMSFKIFLENTDNKIQELSDALYSNGYSKERRLDGYYINPRFSRKLQNCSTKTKELW